jgi:F-type H+-transporting ATPase subunit delta
MQISKQNQYVKPSSQLPACFWGFNKVSSTDIGAIAERYAAALFELAEQEKALEAVETDLKALKGMIAESRDLQTVLRSPIIGRAEQGAAVTALASKAKWHKLSKNFLGLLARNRRLFALPGIIDAFLARLAAKRGEVTAKITSATALSAAQKKSLTTALKKAMGQDVLLDLEVDPSLLGGMVAKVGSRMIDASLKTKLQQLTLALKGVR